MLICSTSSLLLCMSVFMGQVSNVPFSVKYECEKKAIIIVLKYGCSSELLVLV